MQHEIKLPQLELNMEEVVVPRWLVAVGDSVNEEDPILEVETQKATVEVPAPRSGYIRKLCVEVDQEINENALLAMMTDDADEALDETDPASTAQPSSAPPACGLPCGLSDAVASVSGDRVLATPLAKKIARERGVDLKTVIGSGPNGRIQRRDMDGLASTSTQTEPDDTWTDLSPTRLALIQQMQRAIQEIPQINVSRQLDVTPLTQKIEGITFTHRLIHAVAMSLTKHPALRSVIREKQIKTQPVSVAVAMETPTADHLEQEVFA